MVDAFLFILVPGPKIHKPLQGCEVMEGEDAHFSIELSAPMVGTWFLNSSQLQHGGRYSVQQNQTKHSLVIHGTGAADDTSEVTFIANGVRDSAILKVKRRWRKGAILIHAVGSFFMLFLFFLQPQCSNSSLCLSWTAIREWKPGMPLCSTVRLTIPLLKYPGSKTMKNSR